MDKKITEKFGVIKIADEVVAAIAGLAATDVAGVSSLAGGITHDRIVHSGEKNLSRGVRISVNHNKVSVRLGLILDGTVSIPEVTKNTIEKTTNAIESMTGMDVSDVRVDFVGVSL